MSDEHHRHEESASPDGERRPGADAAAGAYEDSPAGNETSAGSDSPAGNDSPSVDLDSLDENALRHLLRDSVRELEPSPDALEHLHRAVPARRARRRQVVVGAAAAVLACSVAVPAMLHADFGPSGEKPMHNAGHAQDHVTEEQEPVGGVQGQGSAADGPDGGPLGATDRGVEAGAPTTGGSAGPDPSSSLGPVSPTCTRDQLSGSLPEIGEADAAGRVYGAFTVVNISDYSCTVEGDGIVLATAQGGAKSTMIQVVDHTTGDEATGLPDPVMATSDEVVLEPAAGYVVEFAWIPREGGGITGCSAPSPSPGDIEGGDGTGSASGPQPMGASRPLQEDTDSEGSGTTGGTGGAGDTSSSGGEGGDGTGDGSGGGSGGGSGTDGGASGGTEDGGAGDSGGSTGGDDGAAPEASVVVAHTPEAGDPVAGEAVIENACAGTLYRTGVLPAA